MPEPQTALPGFSPCHVPVVLHHVDGRAFVVSKISAWGYLEHGVFATGCWHGAPEEKDVLIPYERIDHYEMDFEALKRYLESSEEVPGESSGS